MIKIMEKGGAPAPIVESPKPRNNTSQEGVLFTAIGSALSNKGAETSNPTMIDIGKKMRTVAAFAGNGENLPVGRTIDTAIGGNGLPQLKKDGEPDTRSYVILGAEGAFVRVKPAGQENAPETTLPLAALQMDASRNMQTALAANPTLLEQANISKEGRTMLNRYAGINEQSTPTSQPETPTEPVKALTEPDTVAPPVSINTPTVTTGEAVTAPSTETTSTPPAESATPEEAASTIAPTSEPTSEPAAAETTTPSEEVTPAEEPKTETEPEVAATEEAPAEPEPAEKEMPQLMEEAAKSMGIPTGEMAVHIVKGAFTDEQFNALSTATKARLIELQATRVLTADQTVELFKLCNLEFNQQNLLGRANDINRLIKGGGITKEAGALAIEAVQSVNQEILTILGKKPGEAWTGEELIHSYYQQVESGVLNPQSIFGSPESLQELVKIASAEKAKKFGITTDMKVNTLLGLLVLIMEMGKKLEPQQQGPG